MSLLKDGRGAKEEDNSQMTEPLKEEILKGLINEKEFFCLDVLNGYVHSKDTEYLNKQYLNGFWDHIFPLLQAMLDIQEVRTEE